MTSKSLKLGLPYFFRHQMSGKVSLGAIPESLKPVSERERTENVIEDILRWADDGGQMLDLGDLIARAKPDTAVKQANERSISE